MYFGSPTADPQRIFDQGIHEGYHRDEKEAFGKGFYFYKTSAAAADNVAFPGSEGKKYVLFGPVLIGETTTKQTDKGQMP